MPSSLRLMLYIYILHYDWSFTPAFFIMTDPIHRPSSPRLILYTCPITVTNPINTPCSLRLIIFTCPLHCNWSYTLSLFTTTDPIHRNRWLRLILYPGHHQYKSPLQLKDHPLFDCSYNKALLISIDPIIRPSSIILIRYTVLLQYVRLFTQSFFTTSDLMYGASSLWLIQYTGFLHHDWWYKNASFSVTNPIHMPSSLRLIIYTCPLHYDWSYTHSLFTTTDPIHRTRSLRLILYTGHFQYKSPLQLKAQIQFVCSYNKAFFIVTDHILRPSKIILIAHTVLLQYVRNFTQALFTKSDLIHGASSLWIILYTCPLHCDWSYTPPSLRLVPLQALFTTTGHI